MAAGTVDLKIEQGASFMIDLVLKNSAGDPIDFTGWTPSWQMRRSPESKVFYPINCAFESPFTTGILTVRLTDEDTALIPCDASKSYRVQSTFYAHDLIVTDPDGNVQRLLMGVVEVSPRITK